MKTANLLIERQINTTVIHAAAQSCDRAVSNLHKTQGMSPVRVVVTEEMSGDWAWKMSCHSLIKKGSIGVMASRFKNEKWTIWQSSREDHKGDKILSWELRKLNEAFGLEVDYPKRCSLKKKIPWNMVLGKNTSK